MRAGERWVVGGEEEDPRQAILYAVRSARGSFEDVIEDGWRGSWAETSEGG